MCKQNLSCSLSVHKFNRIKRRNSTLCNLLTFLLSNNNVRAISGKTRSRLNKMFVSYRSQKRHVGKGAMIEQPFPANTPDSSHRHLGDFLKRMQLDLCLDAAISWSRNLPEQLVLSFQTSCANNFHNLFSHSMKKCGLFEARTAFSVLSVPFLMHSCLLAPSLTTAEHKADLCRKLFTGIPKSFSCELFYSLSLHMGS